MKRSRQCVSGAKLDLENVSPMLANVELIAAGVGRMICLECDGNPEASAAAFGGRRHELAPNGCGDCKNRGWLFVNF